MASHSSFESLCDSTSQWAFVSCGANEPFLTNSLNSDPVEDFRLNAWKKRSLNCHYVVINQLPHNQWTFKFQVSDPNLGMSPESSGGQCEPCSVTHTSPSLRWLHHRSLTFSSAFAWATLIQDYLVWGFQGPAKAQWLFSFWIMPHMLKSHWAMMSKKKISFARGRKERHLILTFQARNGREHETQWTSETIVNY